MDAQDSWSPKKPPAKRTAEHGEPPPLGAPGSKPIPAAAFSHATEPPPKPAPPGQSPHDRFLASMIIDYEKWHDGIGYDLDALAQLTPPQRDAIEKILLEHSPRDWRDIEALGHIDSPAAKAAVIAALHHSDPSIRREAQTYAPERIDPQKRAHLLISAIHAASTGNIASQTLDELAEFHPPAVIDALFRAALNSDGDSAVHFAALLYFIHGKATEPFDWNHRPFFLRFLDADRTLREAAFRELCQNVGVDPNTYH